MNSTIKSIQQIRRSQIWNKWSIDQLSSASGLRRFVSPRPGFWFAAAKWNRRRSQVVSADSNMKVSGVYGPTNVGIILVYTCIWTISLAFFVWEVYQTILSFAQTYPKLAATRREKRPRPRESAAGQSRWGASGRPRLPGSLESPGIENDVKKWRTTGKFHTASCRNWYVEKNHIAWYC